MNSYNNTRTIHEKSKIIPIIQQTSPTNKKVGINTNEYSLKQNFFDPSKNSPPNEFMLKLHLRMSQYDSIKEYKRINE